MNIEQAKKVPLCVILDKMNCSPTKDNANEAWYLSPLRIEKTPSLHINKQKNVWYDFGEGKGGNSLDLVCQYLESVNENNTPSDGLRWIKNMTGYAPMIANVATINYAPLDKKLILRKRKPIEHPALVQYLEKRGIPFGIASELLSELHVFNSESKKTFFTLGIRNEDGGYETRSPIFKASVGKKSITFVRGSKPKPDSVNLFEGMMDYLSIITCQKGKKLEGDTIILNSLSCLKKASPYINDYGYKVAYTWMDNDAAGKKADQSLVEFFQTQKSLEFIAMNDLYAPYKDVNAWHMAKLGLTE
jgi:hypothetical protein